MDKALLREFIFQLDELDEKEYLLSTVAYGAALTLKGMKPSSLMSFSAKGRNLYRLWGKYKHDVCRSLGLRFFELKVTEERQLVLFYNDKLLEKVVADKRNRTFLNGMGYKTGMTLGQTLQLLKTRFEHMCPHEIGIFLGIPVEDVTGFIEHKGEKCLFCSYWKVYHNPERAKSLFECYDRVKAGVIRSMLNVHLFGKTIVEAS